MEEAAVRAVEVPGRLVVGAGAAPLPASPLGGRSAGG